MHPPHHYLHHWESQENSPQVDAGIEKTWYCVHVKAEKCQITDGSVHVQLTTTS